MACEISLKAQEKAAAKKRLKDLEKALAKGTVTIKVSPSGAIAFAGWEDRGPWSDACAYRRLAVDNPFVLRQAVARGEAQAGRKVSEREIAAGTHSHDSGKTWGGGHGH